VDAEKINSQISKLTYMRDSLLRHQDIKANDTLITIIFKMYLSLESVTKIAAWVNSQGYRIPSHKGERKYRVTDIRDILNEPQEAVSQELRYIVQKIFKANKHGSKIKEWDDKWRQ